MKKSLFIASLSAVLALTLAACNKTVDNEQSAPETSVPADSDNTGATPDTSGTAPLDSTEVPSTPDTENSGSSENK